MPLNFSVLLYLTARSQLPTDTILLFSNQYFAMPCEHSKCIASNEFLISFLQKYTHGSFFCYDFAGGGPALYI